MRFHYRARDRRGAALAGAVEADSAEAVAERLMRSGITPIDIEAQATRGDLGSRLAALRARLTPRGIDDTDLARLARELHTLCRAGIPLTPALRVLAASTHKPPLAELLQGLADDLEAGRDLASALGRHPRLFSHLFISLVRVGETSGRLDQALLQLARHLDAERDNRERVKAALRYPLVVIGAVLIAIGVINNFVVPTFSGVFARLGADLPLATRALMASSEFTLRWWPLLLAGSALGGLALRHWLRSRDGRYHWGRLQLQLPLLGAILQRAALARFTRSLGLALGAGVPLLQSLSVAAGSLDNDYLEARAAQMRSGVERGESLSRTAASSGLFTPLVLQMLSVGEQTGALDELLLETAEHYEREVGQQLKTLNDSLEPILICAVGALVLLLALGVFLPMWDLAAAARSG